MRKNLLLLCLILALSPAIHPEDLDDPYLSPERRQEIIRNQEDKWDMDAHPSPSWPAGNGTSHLLKPETVHLRPGQNGTFQLGPLRIIVPPGAFGNQSVEIQVLLLTQPKDFVLAGIPLDFSENGKPGVLISDGMFHLQFLDSRGQAIKPVQPLTVEMQPSDPEDMGMYRRDGTSWTRVGSAGIEQRWPEDCDVYRNQYNGQPELILVEESPCGESVAMRFYQGIDEPAWWNFDKPASNITCIKGELNIPGKGLQIRLEAAGLDYLGLSRGTVKPDGRFAMNVAADRKVKVYALLTDKSTRRIYLGSLPTLQASSTTAFYNDGDDSGCQNVGTLKVHKGQIRHLNDADFLMKSIGLP